jgi:hypothetical protein
VRRPEDKRYDAPRGAGKRDDARPRNSARTCARVDLEKGGSMKEIRLRVGLIVGV